MKVIVTGASGYVGEGVLLECLFNDHVEKVLSIGRRPCDHTHPKLEEYIVEDFMRLKEGDSKLEGYDAVFFCAGISSVGMPEEKYKVISHDIPMHFAEILPHKEKMTFIYVSGAGNYKSTSQMWVRVKKSTEDGLASMPFKGEFNFRPAIMTWYKGQKHIQKMQYAFRVFYPLIRLFGGGNTMSEVGRAMISASEVGYPTHTIGVYDIIKLSRRLG
jgi:nucleoside-diphosphate-sugar epimerase